MSTEPNKPEGISPTPEKTKRVGKKRRPLWWRITKWVLLVVVVLIALLVAAIGTAVWILTPEKLTPLVERVGSEYLNADVKLSRVELTYWSTFPSLQVRVDSLDVISHALDGLPLEQKRELPSYTDSLLHVEAFTGKVDLASLLMRKIELKDLMLTGPKVNIVVVNDSLANFRIFPPSAAKDSTASEMPDITLNRFKLLKGMQVRFYNPADTIDVNLAVCPTELDGEKAPTYTLDTGAEAEARIGNLALPKELNFHFDGKIEWNHSEPNKIGLEGCRIGTGPISAILSAKADFENNVRVESLDLILEPLDVTRTLEWLPAEYTQQLAGLTTDMRIGATVQLTTPYVVGQKELPSADITLDIPECKATYQQMTLNKLELQASGHFDASAPQLSKVEVKKLSLAGEGVDVHFTGSASDLSANPLIKGRFEGGIDFAKVPSALMQMLPMSLKGKLQANATLRLRPSYFNRLEFHKLNINGNVKLKEFYMAMSDSSGNAYVRSAELKFGSDSKVTMRNGHTLDSLLTAKITIDTASYNMDGLKLITSNLKAAAGISNKAASADTTVVVPIGLNISADLLRYVNTADSSRIMLRKPKIGATVRRFKDSKKRPLITARVSTERLRYVSDLGRISLKEPGITLRLYPSARPRMDALTSAVYDSISAKYPTLRADSIYKLTRMAMRQGFRRGAGQGRRTDGRNFNRRGGKGAAATDSMDFLDMRVDKQTRSLLLWWNASGHITAKGGRLTTPYFPLRNRLHNFDLKFDMDSMVLKNTEIKSGRSNLNISGRIENYTNAMLRKNADIRLRLDIKSDTLDVNQLADAAFAGAAYAEQVAENAASKVVLSDTESDEAAEAQISAESKSSGPLLIPMNVNGAIFINGKTAIYEGLTLNDLHGELMMYQGALSVRQLSATTDAGSVNLNALYEAPTKNDMKLGLGLQLKNFYIERFAKLFPALDSIMPVLNTMSGRIQAEMAATTDIEPNMDLDLKSLNALLTIRGDNLVVIDPDTYKTISKWLLFRDKNRNVIDSISTQLAIENGTLEVYPFIFNFDRYRLGVMGNNDFALNLNYHVSVLKSPIPFKFGVNIKGTPDNMKIRLGGAKVKENMAVERLDLVSNQRINLIKEMESVFARGMRNARMRRVQGTSALGKRPDLTATEADTISHADSLQFIKEGLIEAPNVVMPTPEPPQKTHKKNRK